MRDELLPFCHPGRDPGSRKKKRHCSTGSRITSGMTGLGLFVILVHSSLYSETITNEEFNLAKLKSFQRWKGDYNNDGTQDELFLVNNYDFENDKWRDGSIYICLDHNSYYRINVSKCLNPSMTFMKVKNIDDDNESEILLLGNEFCVLKFKDNTPTVASWNVRRGALLENIALTNNFSAIDVNDDGINELIFQDKTPSRRSWTFQFKNKKLFKFDTNQK